MDVRAIVVIGASEGGVQALRDLVGALPKNFPAAVFVVMHIGARRSELAVLLDRTGPLAATHAADGDLIEGGHIHVAPPDHHMVIAEGAVRLTKGPRENFARPSIDPLFRSAAQAYGSAVIGVILTGGLSDGTAGLYEIKQRGGATVVQDPSDAINPSMPRSALSSVEIDHCVPLAKMARLIVRLVSELADPPPRYSTPAKGLETAMDAQFRLDQPTALTCPDCGGALSRGQLGSLTQFRCHIGHVYSADVMASGQLLALERFIESAMRSLNERAELCRQMANEANLRGRAGNGAEWSAARQEAHDRVAPLRDLLDQDWMHPAVNEPEPGSIAAGIVDAAGPQDAIAFRN